MMVAVRVAIWRLGGGAASLSRAAQRNFVGGLGVCRGHFKEKNGHTGMQVDAARMLSILCVESGDPRAQNCAPSSPPLELWSYDPLFRLRDFKTTPHL